MHLYLGVDIVPSAAKEKETEDQDGDFTQHTHVMFFWNNMINILGPLILE